MLAIDGVSKTRAMIGWAARPADLISAPELMQSQSVRNDCSFTLSLRPPPWPGKTATKTS
jgi:hypothetical protein